MDDFGCRPVPATPAAGDHINIYIHIFGWSDTFIIHFHKSVIIEEGEINVCARHLPNDVWRQDTPSLPKVSRRSVNGELIRSIQRWDNFTESK